MKRGLLWFRQDLRLSDNPALFAASHCEELLAVYIKDTADPHPIGEAQQWWLHHSLQALKKDLQAHGIRLHCLQGDAKQRIPQLVEQYAIDTVFWNRRYTPGHQALDRAIKSQIQASARVVHSFNGSLLIEPWTVLNKQGEAFKVFTPFWRACVARIVPSESKTVQAWPKSLSIPTDRIEDWALLPHKPNWAAGFHPRWQPGEAAGLDKVARFLEQKISLYKQHRDRPSASAISELSPHLHFGELSVQRLYQCAQEKLACMPEAETGIRCYLSELGWREFSYYLLHHFPALETDNFRAAFDRFPWQYDANHLHAWQRGKTGFPIVDAGMRELWQTGFMHNRVRMIVASFLCKHCLIDWREGARWFWDTLLDADLASNSASWQWVAGCGADAAPYFRIFNPVLQGEKFDADGRYVTRYIPELSHIEPRFIHKPWEAPADQQAKLYQSYVPPILDHAWARKRALEAYEAIKS